MTAVVAAAPFSFKDFLKGFMLVELLKGMALTGRYAFRRKLHCLQALRSCLPCDGHHD